MGWGFVDQAASSGTNLLLTIVAARVLGAHSLGIVVIGFAVYLTVVGFQRALVSQPLVVATAASQSELRRSSSRCAVTTSLIFGVGVAGLMLAVGLATGGTIGRALLIFSPWMPFVLIQDLWRSMLFRDSSGRAAAANDVLWLAVMLIALVPAWMIGTDWAIVGAWGLGAMAGALAGFFQTRLLLATPLRALKQWRSDLWPFGRWLFVGSVAYGASSQASVFLIAALLGPAAVGGVRAVETVFAPLSLLLPAISLPALPIMTRRLAISPSKGKRFAIEVSGVLMVITAGYVVLAALGGDTLLVAVFGNAFRGFNGLIIPIAIQQVVMASGGGFDLLLQGGKRGRAIVLLFVATAPLSLGLVAVTAATGTIVTVAWGLVVARLAVVLATAAVALKGTKRGDHLKRMQPVEA
jgi:O-antigen/teichoic acid export membrane protein